MWGPRLHCEPGRALDSVYVSLACSLARCSRRSGVVIHEVFEGRRALPRRLHVVFTLVLEPHVNHVLREDVAFEQELMVVLERVQGLFERGWHAFDVPQLLGRQGVDVLVERATWVDL